MNELRLEMIIVLILSIFVVAFATILLIHFKEDKYAESVRIFAKIVIIFQICACILFECIWATMLAGGTL